MFRLVPPLGTPIKLRHLCLCLSSFFLDYKILERKAANKISDMINCKNIYFTSSGTSALWAILSILKKYDNRNEVIIPAYTCSSVLTAITKAGLKAKFIDVSLSDYNLDVAALEKELNENTLAIVATHLFGFACDIKMIVKLAKRRKIFVIEDAAQSLGAQVGDRTIGTFGDMSFFSFGKSKNISIVSGGAICVHNEIFKHQMNRLFEDLPQPNLIDELRSLIRIILYTLAIIPCAFFFIHKFNLYRIQLFSFSRGIARLDRVRLGLFGVLMKEFRKITFQRIHNANILSGIVAKTPYFQQGKSKNGNLSVYPSFPLIAKSAIIREKICNRLIKAGIAAVPMYTKTTPKINAKDLVRSQRFNNSDILTNQLFILPTIPFLNESDMRTIGNILLSDEWNHVEE